MTDEMECRQVRDLAPELALGIAEGDERDAALRHLVGCAECRELVVDLSSIGDELLLLAPDREPPPGFESRVLARIAEPATYRSPQPLVRPKRWFALAAATAAFAATLGGGVVFWATADDRRVAEEYQAVLSQGQGDFFLAAPLEASQDRVGTVFGYQGDPSWAMVTLQPSFQEEGRFQVEVVTRDGRYLRIGDAVLGGAQRTWGGQLPVDFSAVHELRFVGSDGRAVLTATFGEANPWG
jgi:hypothetical protein